MLNSPQVRLRAEFRKAPVGSLDREVVTVGFGLLDAARKGRPLYEPMKVGSRLLVILLERHCEVRVEQGGSRGAVGHGKALSHRPGLRSELAFEHGESRLQHASCL